ncbi:MAG: hypothetical protein DRN81_02340 [Thermoproteota archaeon]|nr:MAG: hypothetical protein DRN81_02340 [Candidatus Korarchaeota archaeon]
MFTEKDIKQLTGLIEMINTNCKFDVNSREIVKIYHIFAWLEELKAKMKEDVEKPVVPDTSTFQGEIKPLPPEVIEEIEEAEKPKRGRKKKT